MTSPREATNHRNDFWSIGAMAIVATVNGYLAFTRYSSGGDFFGYLNAFVLAVAFAGVIARGR